LFYTTKNIWEIAQIEDTTKSHISRATYNYNIATPLTGPANIWNWSDLEQYENLNNPEENIYYLDQTLNVNGPLTVPEGAHTVIVENGDLNIGAYANIRYEDAQFGFNHYTYKDDADYGNLASVAFVVLNGNININHSVSDMVGVYYVDNGGLYNSGAERDPIGEQLRIYGSVYGDIENLMLESGFVGPPELDHGAIVIRYDERVILNTPPGLSEYVDFYSEKVAR
ncbi:hypothetical protein KJ764_06140, partial [Patescibacteria group bacterium]|nr:hypothetical protein [Patescibacteria group bacterium]